MIFFSSAIFSNLGDGNNDVNEAPRSELRGIQRRRIKRFKTKFLGVGEKKGKPKATSLVNEPGNLQIPYRFEYWKRALEPRRPYFFRSFTLESLVSKSAFFNGGRNSGFKPISALLTPCLIAPA